MSAMHEIEEQQAERLLFDAGSMRSDPSRPAETQAAAPGDTADTFSVRRLAAHDDHRRTEVLRVHGEIDLETAPMLREALLPVLEHETGPVVVDLCEVRFMDSTGVHVLVDTHERLRLEDRRLAIACREGSQVHRVLGLVGLLDALTVYRSREEAVIGGEDLLGPASEKNRGPSQRER